MAAVDDFANGRKLDDIIMSQMNGVAVAHKGPSREEDLIISCCSYLFFIQTQKGNSSRAFHFIEELTRERKMIQYKACIIVLIICDSIYHD